MNTALALALSVAVAPVFAQTVGQSAASAGSHGLPGLPPSMVAPAGTLYGAAWRGFGRLKAMTPEQRLELGAQIWQSAKFLSALFAVIAAVAAAAVLLGPR